MGTFIVSEKSKEPSKDGSKWYIFLVVTVGGIAIGLFIAYIVVCSRRRWLNRKIEFSPDVQHSYHNSFYELDAGKLGDDNFYESVGTSEDKRSPRYDELSKVRDPENTYESLQ